MLVVAVFFRFDFSLVDGRDLKLVTQGGARLRLPPEDTVDTDCGTYNHGA